MSKYPWWVWIVIAFAADFILANLTVPGLTKYRMRPGSGTPSGENSTSFSASDQQVAGPISGALGIWYPKLF